MKFPVCCAAFLLVLVAASFTFPTKNVWKDLLDKDLSQWEMYISYRHKNGYAGEVVKDDKGDTLAPIGYNKNENKVFRLIQENGEHVLHISGEIYGCVFTKQEFENYHLKLKVKWGQKKWEPRLHEDMDSGILFHSQGPCGADYWRSWMLSQEFQIIENSMGDYWSIASSQIDIKATKAMGRSTYQYDKEGNKTSFGEGTGNSNFCQSATHLEKPKGEWNDLELLCFEDKSLFIVNGQMVMALSNSRYVQKGVSKPLTKGKIQLQSEAAEVFFKDIKIRPIASLPSQYSSYF